MSNTYLLIILFAMTGMFTYMIKHPPTEKRIVYLKKVVEEAPKVELGKLGKENTLRDKRKRNKERKELANQIISSILPPGLP